MLWVQSDSHLQGAASLAVQPFPAENHSQQGEGGGITLVGRDRTRQQVGGQIQVAGLQRRQALIAIRGGCCHADGIPNLGKSWCLSAISPACTLHRWL